MCLSCVHKVRFLKWKIKKQDLDFETEPPRIHKLCWVPLDLVTFSRVKLYFLIYFFIYFKNRWKEVLTTCTTGVVPMLQKLVEIMPDELVVSAVWLNLALL